MEAELLMDPEEDFRRITASSTHTALEHLELGHMLALLVATLLKVNKDGKWICRLFKLQA